MKSIFKTGKRSFYIRGDLVPVNDNVNYLQSGSVALFSVEDGKKHFIFAYKTGEIFPYFNFDTELILYRKLVFSALTNLTLLSMPRKKFETEVLLPENVHDYVNNLKNIIQLQMIRIDNMQRNTILERLLLRLYFFVDRLGVIEEDKAIIDSILSHADIATSIGTTRETVNRLMKKLEKDGLISIKKQIVIINSISRLQSLLNDYTQK